jgi:hypothetical protein
MSSSRQSSSQIMIGLLSLHGWTIIVDNRNKILSIISHRLKKRGEIEATVKENPTALSTRRQQVVVSPEVERALVLWVEDMLVNGHVVNGPLLTTKRKAFEEKFGVPPERRLMDKGWLQGFYRRKFFGLVKHL